MNGSEKSGRAEYRLLKGGPCTSVPAKSTGESRMDILAFLSAAQERTKHESEEMWLGQRTLFPNCIHLPNS